jgi:hypothetical protein
LFLCDFFSNLQISLKPAELRGKMRLRIFGSSGVKKQANEFDPFDGDHPTLDT